MSLPLLLEDVVDDLIVSYAGEAIACAGVVSSTAFFFVVFGAVARFFETSVSSATRSRSITFSKVLMSFFCFSRIKVLDF